MRYSEFWDLVDDVFGPRIGRTLVTDQVLGPLGERTGAQALEDGEEPRVVWRALCDAMDVPKELRWGSDRRPPGRGRGADGGGSSSGGAVE